MMIVIMRWHLRAASMLDAHCESATNGADGFSGYGALTQKIGTNFMPLPRLRRCRRSSPLQI